MSNNGLFRISDEHANEIGGYPLLPSWWSRMYEYPWALRYADLGTVVADMGAGWSGRPLKDALAEVCETVYAVDLDERLLELPKPDNVKFIIADFTKDVPIPKVDTIFCISVLEDLINLFDALKTFKSLLKPDGKIIITTDTPWDRSKPTPKYPGTNLAILALAVFESGLGFVGDGFPWADFQFSWDPDTSLVHHEEWNLACFHCVLEHA